MNESKYWNKKRKRKHVQNEQDTRQKKREKKDTRRTLLVISACCSCISNHGNHNNSNVVHAYTKTVVLVSFLFSVHFVWIEMCCSRNCCEQIPVQNSHKCVFSSFTSSIFVSNSFSCCRLLFFFARFSLHPYFVDCILIIEMNRLKLRTEIQSKWGFQECLNNK